MEEAVQIFLLKGYFDGVGAFCAFCAREPDGGTALNGLYQGHCMTRMVSGDRVSGDCMKGGIW
jgi:hypothetical protein